VLAFFGFYLLVMAAVLVAPNNFRGHNVLVGGVTWEQWQAYVATNSNLVPLRGLSQQVGEILAGPAPLRAVIYLVGNVVGFIPLGYFLPRAWPRQRRFLVFLGTVLLAVAWLEVIQVATMRGSLDVDDIILNTVGAGLGFWATRGWPRVLNNPRHPAGSSNAVPLSRMESY
jgi:glycopeptide antibiotics resistance protein